MLLLGLGLAGVAPAGAAPPEGEPRSSTVPVAEQEAAQEYWTPERMEAAAAAEDLAGRSGTASAEVEAADPTRIPGEPASAGSPRSTTVEGSEDLSGTDHIGKVFFTVDGKDYVCSGNVVASTNGSTVATAGHCAIEGGSWASNWAFAPGYDHGETPHGLWAASELVATEQWSAREDISYDVAFAEVAPEQGTDTLTETVGASGIAFGEERGQSYTAYGYPAEAPFDGQSLEICRGTAADDTVGGSADQGIDCAMTGGSSGGPWFLGDGPDGYQNSVNSWGYDARPGVMYGPYFGDVVQATYEDAAA